VVKQAAQLGFATNETITPGPRYNGGRRVFTFWRVSDIGEVDSIPRRLQMAFKAAGDGDEEKAWSFWRSAIARGYVVQSKTEREPRRVIERSKRQGASNADREAEEKLNLIEASPPGYPVYVTMGGVCRGIKFGCHVYEVHQEKVVLIDADERFALEFLQGDRKVVPDVAADAR
jgi:hypothetical protein